MGDEEQVGSYQVDGLVDQLKATITRKKAQQTSFAVFGIMLIYLIDARGLMQNKSILKWLYFNTN